MTTPEPVELLHALGNRVKARRQALGLTQERLGELAGLHRNYIGGIEQGRRNVSVINLVRLCVALGVDTGELLANLHAPR